MIWLTVTEYLLPMTFNMLFVVILMQFFLHSWLITGVWNKSNTMGATFGAGIAYHSGAPKFITSC